MFEKEAEEYIKKDGTKAEQILNKLNEISPLKIKIKQVPYILAMIQQVYQDGAEFGYNKAMEELNQKGLALQSDMDKTIEQNIALKKELNRANEWHFVKDGDLPKEESLECLCIIRPMKEEGESFENKDFRGVLYFRNGKFYLDEDNSNDCLKETNSDFTDLVIAWKEIVLPELKESEWVK